MWRVYIIGPSRQDRQRLEALAARGNEHRLYFTSMMAYLHQKSHSTLEFIVRQFTQREHVGSNPAFNAWSVYRVLAPVEN